MKKLLSLFVVGVVGLFAGANVSAMDFYTDNGWNIAMEGEFAGYALYSGNNVNYGKRWQAIGYGALGLSIEKELMSETTIGLHTALEAVPDTQYSDKEIGISEVYLSLEGKGGRLEIGNTPNISRKIHISTPDVAIMDMDGVSGIDYILRKSDVDFLATTAINTDEDKTKVNYISPKIYGFQIAGSYIPKTESINEFEEPEFGTMNDGFTGGIKYSYDGDFNFKFSANMAKFYDVREPNSITNKREEYSLGALFYRKGLQFTTSYRHISEDKSIGDKSQEGYVVDGGVAYEIGPLSASLTQRHSKLEGDTQNREYDRMNLTMLSAKYAMMQHLALSSGIGRIAFDGEEDENKVGIVFVGGLVLSI